MIKIINKENCCGCSACVSICPKKSISMKADDEGFLYPSVDKNTCVDCGLCEKVCNSLHPYSKQEPLEVLAAINKNEEVRLNSSSGGIFYLLANKIISKGGVVFGARFDENWQVLIDYAEDMNSVKAFMGSKYVQARMDTAYNDAKRFLIEGRMVLFSGTPCQIAGLHKFLRRPYDNLITVDFICHGTPSPLVWKNYLQSSCIGNKEVSHVNFRSKKNGWKRFCFSINYTDSVPYMAPHPENLYMKAFLQDIILRPSCYSCKVKGGSSKSDITMADFGGIETIDPKFDDDKGTSMVFINTENGHLFFDYDNIQYLRFEYEQVKDLNIAYHSSALVHPRRKKFFRSLRNEEELLPLLKKCTRPTFRQKLWKIEDLIFSFFKR